MLELTGVHYSTIEQNKDMSKFRQARDMRDTQTLLVALAEKSPFAPHDHLMNFMTGVHAEESVNVERAKEMGQNILDSMTGKQNSPSKVVIRLLHLVLSRQSQLDPQLLFHHLTIACHSLDDIRAMFQYELCSYPTSL